MAVPCTRRAGVKLSVCLTDKFPNVDALCPSSRVVDQTIRYHPQPVDGTRVPEELSGFRTMFSAFHHFRLEEARAVLANAVRKRQGIAVFEGTHHSAVAMLLMLLVGLT